MSSSAAAQQEGQHEVRLAIYDLSQGMARSLSAQFLGPDYAIDIIPHTGVLVYGQEYFFGNSTADGIAAEHPDVFRATRGIYPIRIESLGRTNVSQQAFETWCVEQNQQKYRGTNYDLLRNNCNNFSNDAALQGLALPRGVPQWILDIPQRFLSSPMGQIVRPMLDNMQLAAGTGGFTPQPRSTSSASTAAPSAASNPWATPAATTPTPPAVQVTKKEPKPIPSTPTLDSYDRPLLSSDNKTATLCAKRVGGQPELLAVAAVLEKGGQKPTPDQLETAYQALNEALSGGTSVVSALMLYRLLVLHHTRGNDGKIVGFLEWIAREIPSTTKDSVLVSSPPARSMAWCAISNVFAVFQPPGLLSQLVDAAVVDTTTAKRPEVKQAAVTFLYNAAHQNQQVDTQDDEQDLSDVHVAMLCGCLDGVVDETDSTTQLRRLLVVGRLLRKNKDSTIHKATASLIQDLGFHHSLQDLASDATEVGKLAGEMAKLLED